MIFYTKKLIKFSIFTRINVLNKLTLRGFNSLMQKRIKISLIKNIKDTVITCKIDGKIVGWSLIYNNNRINIFIAVKYRKKGIGKELLLRSERYIKRSRQKIAYVSPWNEIASNFYYKNNYIVIKTRGAFNFGKDL